MIFKRFLSHFKIFQVDNNSKKDSLCNYSEFTTKTDNLNLLIGETVSNKQRVYIPESRPISKLFNYWYNWSWKNF